MRKREKNKKRKRELLILAAEISNQNACLFWAIKLELVYRDVDIC